VDEVIQKRLLLKNAKVKPLLNRLTKREKQLRNAFEFTDGATLYRNFKDKQHLQQLSSSYQFNLFQTSIETLSAHAAFEGRHSSVGERSMSCVQEVR
jgi:hypothetical protein